MNQPDPRIGHESHIFRVERAAGGMWQSRRMLEIRPITDSDIDAVGVVHVRTWQVCYAGIIPDDYLAALDPAVSAERRRAHLGTPRTATLVAVADGDIVGFAAFGPYRPATEDSDPDCGELYALYVLPSHWGTGAGRALMAAVKEAMAAAGWTEIRLWVLAANDRARRFYERAGLRPDGEQEMFTPHGTTVELPELRYSAAL
jgi:GNAT superfamily N-acetyltransferase